MLGKAGNQVNANVGEFCSVSFVFFMAPLII